jgi:hypothetical protein
MLPENKTILATVFGLKYLLILFSAIFTNIPRKLVHVNYID